MSYATLYPYLVALAARGIHAYVEAELSARIYCDVGQSSSST